MNNLLTAAGMERLRNRLNTLQSRDLVNAQNEVVNARSEGKLEENEAYLHALGQLNMVEHRIADLTNAISTHEVVSFPPPTDHIGFGSTALIEDLKSEVQRKVTLVGEPEADINLGMISITSPLGEALMGASVGDVVDLVLPKGTTQYEVIEIF